jgi:hypothetical protein
MSRSPRKPINPEQLRTGPSLAKVAASPKPHITDDERLCLYQDAIEDLHDRAAADGNWKAQLAAVKLAVDTIISVKKKRVEDNPNDGEEEPDLTGVKDIAELRKLAEGGKG